jgi:hypothetical protein
MQKETQQKLWAIMHIPRGLEPLHLQILSMFKVNTIKLIIPRRILLVVELGMLKKREKISIR